MPRDARRRRGLLDDDDVRIGPGELLALVSHPRGARAGLAVRQGEDEVGEVARAGAQGGLGGVGRQAADQQKVAGHPGRHACTARVCGPRKEMLGWNGISWSGGARRRPGKRRVSSSSASVASRRPSAEPMQKWMPRPNASVRREFGRSGSNAVRVGEDLGVAAGGREPEEELRPLGQVDAAEVHRPGGHPPPHRHRRVEAQDLVHGAGDQVRVLDEPVPAFGELEQPPDAVADQVVRRLVPGEAEREQDRGDVLLRESVGVLVVDLQQRAGEVVGAVGGLGGDQLAQVAAVEHHLLRVVQRLLRRRPAPGQARPAAAPLLELRPVLLRHAHEAEHDPHRQRERQRVDEVERLRRVDGVEQLGGGRADARLHLGDPSGREAREPRACAAGRGRAGRGSPSTAAACGRRRAASCPPPAAAG